MFREKSPLPLKFHGRNCPVSLIDFLLAGMNDILEWDMKMSFLHYWIFRINVILIAALPNFMYFQDSYTTRLLCPVIFFFTSAQSILTCVLLTVVLANFIYFWDSYITIIAASSEFFFFPVFMGVKHTYMYFSGCTITGFRVLLKFLYNTVAASSDFFFHTHRVHIHAF